MKKLLILAALVSIASFAQTPISGSVVITPNSHDPDGYIVEPGATLTLDGGFTQGNTFPFNPNKQIWVQTGGKLEITSGHLHGINGQSWMGIKADGNNTFYPDPYNNIDAVVIIRTEENVSITNAEIGIHSVDIQTDGQIGYPAVIHIEQLEDGNTNSLNTISFENQQDVKVEATVPKNCYLRVLAEEENGVQFIGVKGIELDKITKGFTPARVWNAYFKSTLNGIVLNQSYIKLLNSNFINNEIAILGKLKSSALIENNQLIQSQIEAIHFENSSNVIVNQNTITEGNTAFNFISTNTSEISSNEVIQMNNLGYISDCDNMYMYRNNYSNSNQGVTFTSSDNAMLKSNKFTQIDGISLLAINSNEIRLLFNTFLDCSTENNTVEFSNLTDFTIASSKFLFTSLENTLVSHSALLVDNNSSGGIGFCQFENYKYASLRIKNSYNTKTCHNFFDNKPFVSIQIEGPIIDQGTPNTGSDNFFQILPPQNPALPTQYHVNSTHPVNFYSGQWMIPFVAPQWNFFNSFNSRSLNAQHDFAINRCSSPHPNMYRKFKDKHNKNHLNISLNNNELVIHNEISKTDIIRVYSSHGQELNVSLLSENHINVSAFKPGIYILQIININGERKHTKFVVK